MAPASSNEESKLLERIGAYNQHLRSAQSGQLSKERERRYSASDEEATLLECIAAYKQHFRRTRWAELSEERQKRHSANEVFFAGVWVDAERVDAIQRALRWREWLLFLEIHVVVTILLGLSFGLWQGFSRFFLP